MGSSSSLSARFSFSVSTATRLLMTMGVIVPLPLGALSPKIHGSLGYHPLIVHFEPDNRWLLTQADDVQIWAPQ